MNNNLQIIKADLIAEVQRREADKVIEPTNAALLIKLINNAENVAEAMAIASMGTVYSKTGFHFETKVEKMGTDIKYLKKNDTLSFSSGNGPSNKLIIGDNYDALLNLLVTHKGMIDVIYIDPPYGSDSMGDFANTNYTNSLSRDNLLSMLYPRLQLAKQLLSKTGIVCVSIDDKNQAYIKCLMDDVFGENNFVANCPRKSAGARTTKSKHELQIIHDYVLVYRHTENDFLTQRIKGEKKYPFEDARGKYYTVPLQDNGPHGTKSARPNLWYPIYEKEDGTLTLDETDQCYLPKQHKHEDGRWMWSKKKFLAESNDLIIEDGTVKIKHYYIEGEDTNKYEAFSSWIDKYQNSNGTKSLASILGANAFDNPKPVELIKYFINLCSTKSCTVLDFFAGSGTTGQAVLELNKEDGGNRTFILCTNNEMTDITPNGIAYDVTSKRLKRVMTGECYDGSSDFKWIEKNKPLGGNLDVYEIAEVNNAEQAFGKTPFDIIDEECYGLKFNSIEEKISWICQNFDKTQKYLSEDTYVAGSY